jgi:dUTP pyrophosphatase
MKIKVKKLSPRAVLPKYAKEGDAAQDLTCIDDGTEHEGFVEYRTGLSFEVPEGYVMLIFPRSSITTTPLSLANSVGVVDSGYRGEITARFRMLPGVGRYRKGERVAQFMVLPYPHVELEETLELSSSARGTGGFGSTGK